MKKNIATAMAAVMNGNNASDTYCIFESPKGWHVGRNDGREFGKDDYKSRARAFEMLGINPPSPGFRRPQGKTLRESWPHLGSWGDIAERAMTEEKKDGGVQ